MSLRDRSPAPRRTWLLVLVFALSLPAVTTRFYASDEVQFYAWLHSWAFDHDADFDNEYQYFYQQPSLHNGSFHETLLVLTNEAGRRFNFAPIGCAVLWAPFYAAGHLAAVATGAPRDGFSHPYVAAVTIGSAIYGFLSVLLSMSIVRRLVGRGPSAALVVWIGTPLLFYTYVAPGFSHACSAFAVSLFIWTWLRVRETWRPGRAILLGAAGALMAMVREQDLFFVAGPALDFLVTQARARGSDEAARPAAGAASRLVGPALAGAAGFVLAYMPQLVAYQALNGHPTPTSKVAQKMSWSSPHALGVLFSPEHGLFFWTPLALVAVCGLVWLASGRRAGTPPDTVWIARLTIVMLVLQVYVSGCVESWTVAGSFGQRRFVAD